jgi:hypothetical protein
MKIKTIPILMVVLLVSLSATSGLATDSSISAGARMHVQHSLFTEIPYADDDMSYGLAYEYQEGESCWQLALMYTPDAGGTATSESVITPQINMILKDRIWRGGFGALMSYIDDSLTGTDWSSVYWQVFLGLDVPLGGLSVSVDAYYPMDSLGDIGDIDTDDLEYGVWIKTPF